MYLELQSSSKLLPSLYFLSLWIDFEASLDLQRWLIVRFYRWCHKSVTFINSDDVQSNWDWLHSNYSESPVFSTNFKSRYFDFNYQFRSVVRELITDLLMSGLMTSRFVRRILVDHCSDVVLLVEIISVSSKFINFCFSIQLSSASFFNNFSILHFFPDVILSSLDVVQCIFEFWWYIISRETMRADWELYVNQFT